MTDEDQVQRLRDALARGADAAGRAALGLWLLAAAIVFLGTEVANRARDIGDAKGAGETVVLETGGLLLVAELLALVALVVAVVLLVRWVRAAGEVLPLVGEDARASGPRALMTLWRAGGEAARPRVVDLFTALLPAAVVVTLVLLVLPRDYESAQVLDLAALAGCIAVLAAALLGVGVLRRISDRHVARAAFVTGADG